MGARVASVTKVILTVLCLLPAAMHGAGGTAKPDASTDPAEFSRRLKLAGQGDAGAEDFVGLCYQKGWGVEKEIGKAWDWYRKSAAQGNASAQDHLGECYLRGYGVDRDPKEAVRRYTLAADKGDAQAEYDLGWCLLNGKGVEADYAKAFDLFQKSAGQGNGDGECGVGICYYTGRGADQDDARALTWFKKAADQGDAKGEFELGACYAEGRGVEIEPGSLERGVQPPAERKSLTDNDLENGAAMRDLTADYLDDSTQAAGRRNYAKAMGWFRKADAQGNVAAENYIGWLYSVGAGVVQDYAEADRWFRKAADKDNPGAEFNLGWSYMRGQGVLQDRATAMELWRRSAGQGYSRAIMALKMEKEGWPDALKPENGGPGIKAKPAALPNHESDPKALRFQMKDGTVVNGELAGCDGGTLDILTLNGHWLYLAAEVDRVQDARGKDVRMDSLRIP
jgi:TPR repeat protein